MFIAIVNNKNLQVGAYNNNISQGKHKHFVKSKKKKKKKKKSTENRFTGTETRRAQEKSTISLQNSVLCNKKALMRFSRLSFSLVDESQIPNLIGKMLRLVQRGKADNQTR